MTKAEEILNGALSDPRATLQAGEACLLDLPEDAHGEASMTLRAMSLAARYVNRVEDSIAFARRASDRAAEGGLSELRFLALLTMSGSMSVAGQHSEALRVVDDALGSVKDRATLAKFRFQRGAILSIMGRVAEAVDVFESVLPEFRDLGDTASIEITLGQLGYNLTYLGRLVEAESYLTESLDLATELDEVAAIPSIEHNLGQLAAYRGDIPAALDWLQRSDEHHIALSGSAAPQHVARCQVLASVGRYSEAEELARRIGRENAKSGDFEHAVNALIVAGEAALLGGRVAEALGLANEILGMIAAEIDSVRHARARRIRDEARLIVEGPSRQLLEDILSTADDLEGSGQLVAAGQAHLLAGRIATSLGEAAAARASLEKVASVRTGPVETRLQAHLARALLRLESGNTRGASAAVRSGLDLLDDYQSVLGASDLRLGIERQGMELASIGLGLALDSGRPRRVLEWLDRTRARSLRFQPVVPTGGDEVMGALARLRQVEAELRQPENRDNSELNRHRRRLQEEIAAADRVRRETKAASADFSIDVLIDSLGDRTLVELGELDDRLFAVVVRKRRARLIELGDTSEVLEELRHVRFGMRSAARRGRPVNEKSLRSLDRMLLGKMSLGDEVVVVPPPSLMAIPWAALRSLRQRFVVVSPSAEIWWQAHRSTPSGKMVLVAGGPDLEIAEQEVELVGALYSNPTILPPGSGVDKVREGLRWARIAHIASHATFQVENPMFSSLRLGDGDLNIYDIERLDHPPDLVVLSACDSGYTEARAGDELAGLTSALLSMGTRSVVASVGLVPDVPATSDLMVRFHRGLIGGLDPARALSNAQSEMLDDPETFVAAASFICVGA